MQLASVGSLGIWDPYDVQTTPWTCVMKGATSMGWAPRSPARGVSGRYGSNDGPLVKHPVNPAHKPAAICGCHLLRPTHWRSIVAGDRYRWGETVPTPVRLSFYCPS